MVTSSTTHIFITAQSFLYFISPLLVNWVVQCACKGQMEIFNKLCKFRFFKNVKQLNIIHYNGFKTFKTSNTRVAYLYALMNISISISNHDLDLKVGTKSKFSKRPTGSIEYLLSFQQVINLGLI